MWGTRLNPGPIAPEKKRKILSFLGITLVVVLGVCAAVWRFSHSPEERVLITSPRDDLDFLAPDPWLMWVTADHLDTTVSRRFDDGRIIQYHVTTGARGIRGGTPGPKEHRLRILAVGDSTTFGLGVRDEDTWCAVLQGILDPGHELIDVVNAGVIGYTLFQARRKVEQLAPILCPDLVLVTVGHNDEKKKAGYGDADTSARKTAPVRYALYARLHNRLFPERPIDPGEQRPRMRRGEFLDDLERFCGITREQGLSLVLIEWPYVQEVFAGQKTLGSYCGLIQMAAAATGTPVIDLAAAFRRAGPTGFMDMVHATPEGNRVIAEHIAEQLRMLFKGGFCEAWQRQSVGRARELLEEGHAAEAAHLLRIHLNISPRAVPYELLGRALAAMGDRSGALDAWTAGMRADPAHYQNLDLAYQLLGEEGPATNREFWQKMTEQLPDANLVWLNLGRAAMELGFHEEAVAALEKSLELGPGNAAALVLLGEARELLGRNRAAIEAYERALAINPDIPGIAARVQALRERDGQDSTP
ncbi:MAG TPA: GDSL-type esterase/lipase family protein [Candidatus Hydrogenedentes bacterium]|nr:GDSL-type esterase/lipase family protein [Candidatus Hydrogenedentota bacterium]